MPPVVEKDEKAIEPDKELFEAKIPEGFEEGEALLSEEAEEAAAEAEAKAEPKAKAKPAAKPAEPESEAKPQPKIGPVAIEERRKRKRYAEMYQEAVRERDRALQALEARDHVDDALPEQEKKYRDDLTRRADEAKTLGEVLNLALGEIDRFKTQERGRSRVESMLTRARISEVNARIRYPDFDEVMTKAGVFDSLGLDASGSFKEPWLARKVYMSPDPGEMAYGYAKGKLAETEAPGGDDEPESLEGPRPKAKAAKGAPEGEAEAERRGARRVIAEVEKASERPKSIRGIRSAGEPSGRYSRAQLDNLMETNPAGYEHLMKANPGLERWHLGGF